MMTIPDDIKAVVRAAMVALEGEYMLPNPLITATEALSTESLKLVEGE